MQEACTAPSPPESTTGRHVLSSRGTEQRPLAGRHWSENDDVPGNGLTVSAHADIFSPMTTAARLFKSLADETRLRILALLGRGELCVCDLMTVLDLPQSTVSRHLACLRNADWVDGRRQGVWMYYRLASGASDLQGELLPLLTRRLAEIPRGREDLAALADYLEQKGSSPCRSKSK